MLFENFWNHIAYCDHGRYLFDVEAKSGRVLPALILVAGHFAPQTC